MQHDAHVWAWRMRGRFEGTNEVWENPPHYFRTDSAYHYFFDPRTGEMSSMLIDIPPINHPKGIG